MSENLIVNKKLEKIREILYDIANLFKNNRKYQKILFVILSIGVFCGSHMLCIYPSQKTIPDYICIPEGKDIMNFTKITKLSNYKIIEDQNCIKKYCYKNQKNQIEKEIKFTNIIVDYTTITNFVTTYDAFCDYNEFFINLNNLIQVGRIIGSTFLSYISDKYGRKNPYFMHIYIMLFFCIGIFFLKSRAFFYIFVFFGGLNDHIYFLICTMANELMTLEYFSVFSSLMGIMFSICGLICNFNMIIFNNFYLFYTFLLIFLIIMLYLSNEYIRETLDFTIKMNLIRQSFNDIKILDKKLVIGIQEDPQRSEQLKNIENFVNEDEVSVNRVKNRYNSEKQLFLNNSLNLMSNKSYEKIPEINNSGIFGPFKLIFENKELTIKFLIFSQLFITVNMNYYGPLLNIELLMDNVYFATFILFLAEFIGETLCGYLLQNNLRIRSMKIGYFSSGFLYLIVSFLDNGVLKIFLLFIAFIITSFLFIATFILTAESFEVEVKNSMLTLTSNLSSIWLIILPYLIKLVPDIYFLFSGSSLISFFLIDTIKETYKNAIDI